MPLLSFLLFPRYKCFYHFFWYSSALTFASEIHRSLVNLYDCSSTPTIFLVALFITFYVWNNLYTNFNVSFFAVFILPNMLSFGCPPSNKKNKNCFVFYFNPTKIEYFVMIFFVLFGTRYIETSKCEAIDSSTIVIYSHWFFAIMANHYFILSLI